MARPQSTSRAGHARGISSADPSSTTNTHTAHTSDNESEQEVLTPEDPRIVWLGNRLTSLLSVEYYQWMHCFEKKETQELLNDFFLTNAAPVRLIFSSDGDKKAGQTTKIRVDSVRAAQETGGITCSSKFGSNLSRHTLVIWKTEAVRLETTHDCTTETTYVHLNPEILNQIRNTVIYAYAPLSINLRQTSVLPSDLLQDLIRALREFTFQSGSAVDSKEGKMSLLMPLSRLAMKDSQVSSLLDTLGDETEHVVSTWTSTIQKASELTSEDIFLEEKYQVLKEIEFRKKKRMHLEGLAKEIRSQYVRMTLRKLQNTGSKVLENFNAAACRLTAALDEARDIARYIAPLESAALKLCSISDSFTNIKASFPVLFHYLRLVQKESMYYGPISIALFIECACSDIISMCVEYVQEDAMVFQSEPSSAISRLQAARDVCKEFLRVYYSVKQVIMGEKDASDVFAWNFENTIAFVSFEKFQGRCDEILGMLEKITLFRKYQGIQIGGSNANRILDIVSRVSEEYEEEVKMWFELDINVLNTGDPEESTVFERHSDRFHTRLNELEHRMALALKQGLESSYTVEGAFHTIYVFDHATDVPAMRKVVEAYLPMMIDEFGVDVDSVFSVFRKGKDDLSLLCRITLPEVAGRVSWVQGLRARAKNQMKMFENLGLDLLRNDSIKWEAVLERYNLFMQDVEAYQTDLVKGWAESVSDDLGKELEKPLLLRNEKRNEVHPHIDDAVVSNLLEVHHLKGLGFSDSIPSVVTDLLQKRKKLQSYYRKLESICNTYNFIVNECRDFEKPLFRKKMEEIEDLLHKGLVEITWESVDMQPFVDAVTKETNTLHGVVQRTYEKYNRIEKMCSEWLKSPLLHREDPNLIGKPFDVDASNATMSDRFAIIKDDAFTISKLVDEICNILRVDTSTEAWKLYVSSVDSLIGRTFQQLVVSSMQYLLDNLRVSSPLDDLPPTNALLLNMELIDGELVYSPSLEKGYNQQSVMDIVHDWVQSFLGCGHVVTRLLDDEPDYMPLITKDERISRLENDITTIVEESIEKCVEFQESFDDDWGHIWKNNPQDYLNFLIVMTNANEGPPEKVKPSNSISASPGSESRYEGGRRIRSKSTIAMESEIKSSKSLVAEFESQIEKYGNMLEDIDMLKETQSVGAFLINCKPFLISLANEVSKCRFVFIQYLLDKMFVELSEFFAFHQGCVEVLESPVEDGDRDTLVQVMECIRNIRHRIPGIDAMFEPLKLSATVLKKSRADVDISILEQLDEAPTAWSNLKKKYFAVKASMQPLCATEQQLIRLQSHQLVEKVAAFNAEFENFEGLKWSEHPEYAYLLLEAQSKVLKGLEDEADKLCEREELFDMDITHIPELATRRTHVQILKQTWDLVDMNLMMLQTWMQCTLDKFDVEVITVQIKDNLAQVQDFESESQHSELIVPICHGLKTYIYDSLRKIPVLDDLRSPALRIRHIRTIVTSIVKNLSPELVLDILNKESLVHLTAKELLGNDFGSYSLPIGSLVDLARKELFVERLLSKIDLFWSSAVPELEQHPAGVPILKFTDDITEHLEDHQLSVHTALLGTESEIFQDELQHWDTTLRAVGDVFSLLWETQRLWVYLSKIYFGGNDIQEKLSEDYPIFQALDTDFRGCLRLLQETPNAVQFCTIEGLHPELERISLGLHTCEKSLATYLESKCIAFPRFFFVSSDDLTTILAEAKETESILRFLPKLFANTQTVDYKTDTQEIVAVKSSEGERLSLKTPCVCIGAVEDWLARFLSCSQDSIHAAIMDAVTSYELKPRHSWLFDHQSQPALVACQVWWTMEVETRFKRLEEGDGMILKNYLKKQMAQLDALTGLIMMSGLSNNDRQKIMNLVIMDVHARDVVQRLVDDNVETSAAFAWKSQMTVKIEEVTELSDEKHTKVSVAEASFVYCNEYWGNGSRLVITPLTDRCYITLTQALHLTLGGAPAGPAGTGKTETTKDLGKALGVMVYVFNCSDQLDYKALGVIFKGLAQSGAWGCFDEFNRIAVEVLSVVSTQFRTILNALRTRADTFDFFGTTIPLAKSCGVFITMNPGYAGRTELPESLKVLFRPVTMIVPDLQLICEIMLVAQGFRTASTLARKFDALFRLSGVMLSRQDHYEWGLRSIKPVLAAAGARHTMGSAETVTTADGRNKGEEEILMMALRDLSVPKLVAADAEIFIGLLQDMFPGIVPKDDNTSAIERMAEQVIMKTMNLQADPAFVGKVLQLRQLLQYRHSVYIVGPAGSGKTQIWRSLSRILEEERGIPTLCSDLDPKAITLDELYGNINRTTREWNDGVFSSLMRRYASMPDEDSTKWITLDGDIDPEWIESLNTLMDDNKILTLPTNERIVLQPSMRLLFEVGHLKCATPATVSRAGIVYVSSHEIGWTVWVSSWLEGLGASRPLQSKLLSLIERLVPPTINFMQKECKKFLPIIHLNCVQTVCRLVEPHLAQLDGNESAADTVMHFACVWGIGGVLGTEDGEDYRTQFDRWWRVSWGPKFPKENTVFDYYVDPSTLSFKPWMEHPLAQDLGRRNLNRSMSTMIRSRDFDTSETSLDGAIRFVATPVSVSTIAIVSQLCDAGRPCLIAGEAGVGKTFLLRSALDLVKANSKGSTLTVNYCLNYYTTGGDLQASLESQLEKKHGQNYGPPGFKSKIIYMLDDMNYPRVDNYLTQSAISLLRQGLDHKHWYDRKKVILNDVKGIQVVGILNPKVGSGTIDPRCQRHFTVIRVNEPDFESIRAIFGSILHNHLVEKDVPPMGRAEDRILVALLFGHTKIKRAFLPTVSKFQYQFNLKDIMKALVGMMDAPNEVICGGSNKVSVLWKHEMHRTYGDRIVDPVDKVELTKLLQETAEESFDNLDPNIEFDDDVLYFHFADGMDKKCYKDSSMDLLRAQLSSVLSDYNEVHPVMDIVLFEDAIQHICRISRILQQVSDALLVGVGGSGRQTLARIASFVGGFEIFQPNITGSYGVSEFKDDLKSVFTKTGGRGMPGVWLMTDHQITHEEFLVFLNDFFTTHDVPNLFGADEAGDLHKKMEPFLKEKGIEVNMENSWKQFMERVRENLRIILCFSPMNKLFQSRLQRFGGLMGMMSQEWFTPWSQPALVSVGAFILSSKREDAESHDIKSPRKQMLAKESLPQVTQFMASSHLTVASLAENYNKEEGKFYQTTPMNYLELISLSDHMFQLFSDDVLEQRTRLENGLSNLERAENDVIKLQEDLENMKVEVAARKIAASELMEKIGQETTLAEAERELVAGEESKTNEIASAVQRAMEEMATELERAEPMVEAAIAALNTLDKPSLVEMKSFSAPAQEIVDVASCVCTLLLPPGAPMKEFTWAASRREMGDVNRFLEKLLTFDRDNISRNAIRFITQFVLKPSFNGKAIRSKSVAAAGLCDWVVNMYKYDKIYQEVQPKRDALAAIREKLAKAQIKLGAVQKKLDVVNGKIDDLTAQFEQATLDKNHAIQQAEFAQERLTIAHRLIAALSGEKVRWRSMISELKLKEEALIGDCLLCSVFVSYAGGFNGSYRLQLLQKLIPRLIEFKIPSCFGGVSNLLARDRIAAGDEDAEVLHGEMVDEAATVAKNDDESNDSGAGETSPLYALVKDEIMMSWLEEGLPSDMTSKENAIILTNSLRWSLLVDPQLQALNWLKAHFMEYYKITSGEKSFLTKLHMGVSTGRTVVIENISESLDASLDNLLSRKYTLRNGVRSVYIGDQQVNVNPDFRLILHTSLATPCFQPEVQAQVVMIDFMVTPSGLEEQLLGVVVNHERTDLEAQKRDTLQEQLNLRGQLRDLESHVLEKLSKSEGNMLDDIDLIRSLENSAIAAAHVKEKVQEQVITEKGIDLARDLYRPVAVRGGIFYFVLNDLGKMKYIYQFSLEEFLLIFQKGIYESVLGREEEIEDRVASLTKITTENLYTHFSAALEENHKAVLAAELCFRVVVNAQEVDFLEVEHLVNRRRRYGLPKPVKWLGDDSWGSVSALKELPAFVTIASDIERGSRKWKEWYDLHIPENGRLPQEWSKKTSFQKLLILQAIRPDRVAIAVNNFVKTTLGEVVATQTKPSPSRVISSSTASTPILFILSPGTTVLSDIETAGIQFGKRVTDGTLTVVSLGQGQEGTAEKAVANALEKGDWVLLQNVHLMRRWLQSYAQELLMMLSSISNQGTSFRLFLTAENDLDPFAQTIPPEILKRSTKVAMAAPMDFKVNFRSAMEAVNPELLESSGRPVEFKTITYALCCFHAIMLGRGKFGPQGWIKSYPFGLSDLKISVDILHFYLENASRTPWEDLVYLIGEIMYGGHITDSIDRRTCRTYLQSFMQEDLLDKHPITNGVDSPSYGNHAHYLAQIASLQEETPETFGLHENAGILYRRRESDLLLITLSNMGRSSVDGGGGPGDQSVESLVDHVLQSLPDDFDTSELLAQGDFSPYTIFTLHECDRMNKLLAVIRESLVLVTAALKGELPMTTDLEDLFRALMENRVPTRWHALAYPSVMNLAEWLLNLKSRHAHITEWEGYMGMPPVVRLCYLFNPRAFLATVLQSYSRRAGTPLDRLMLYSEVTRKTNPSELKGVPKEGAYVYGLQLDGAKWDTKNAALGDPAHREVFATLPILFLKPMSTDTPIQPDVYECPVYSTIVRGNDYIFTIYLRSKDDTSHWILAGVAAILAAD